MKQAVGGGNGVTRFQLLFHGFVLPAGGAGPNPSPHAASAPARAQLLCGRLEAGRALCLPSPSSSPRLSLESPYPVPH